MTGSATAGASMSIPMRRGGAPRAAKGGGTAGEARGRAAPEPVPAPRAAPQRPALIVFVGGLYDSRSQQVGRVFNRTEGQQPSGMQVRYASHDQEGDILAAIRAAPTGTRIVLVGHSWGGDTVATIASRLGEQGRPVDMLVTIDPVGHGLSEDFMRRVRAGAQEWINVNAAGGSASETSNLIAEAGRKYGRLPEAFASQYIDAPYTHAQFGPMIDLRLPGASGTLYQRVMGR